MQRREKQLVADAADLSRQLELEVAKKGEAWDLVETQWFTAFSANLERHEYVHLARIMRMRAGRAAAAIHRHTFERAGFLDANLRVADAFVSAYDGLRVWSDEVLAKEPIAPWRNRVRALLDASSLAMSGESSASNTVLGPIARILEGLRAEFDESATTGEAAALLRSIAEALDAEIARWETRSESDPEARAVWRAFLGLRELLWEFGIRRESDEDGSGATSKPAARKKGRSTSTRRKQPRVQRVTVEE